MATPLASQFTDRVIALHPDAETREDTPTFGRGDGGSAGSPARLEALPAADDSSPATSERREANRAPVGTGAARIKSIISQLEYLDEQIAGLKTDRSEIVKGAKDEGYNPKAIAKVIAIRKKHRDELAELGNDVRLYLSAIGDDRQDDLFV
jgi:uncharacterized protein (UPF0335 family)